MKTQKIVRTYPSSYIDPTAKLEQALKYGFRVVMCNEFDCKGKKGLEYILEKDDAE